MASVTPVVCDYLIIGGGIAGTSCAQKLESDTEAKSIIVLSAAPSLKIASHAVHLTRRLETFDVTESSLADACNARVQVVLAHVEHVDPKLHQVRTSDGRVYQYGRLTVCSGARPVLVADHPHVIGIRDTESVADLSKRLHSARRIMVVGNGGIALELVYALRLFHEVVWVIKDSYIGNTFLDRTASAFVMPFLFPEHDPVSSGDAGTCMPAVAPMQVDSAGTSAAGVTLASASRDPAVVSPDQRSSDTTLSLQPREPTSSMLTIIDEALGNAWPPHAGDHDAPVASANGAAQSSHTQRSSVKRQRYGGGGLGPQWITHVQHNQLPRHQHLAATTRTTSVEYGKANDRSVDVDDHPRQSAHGHTQAHTVKVPAHTQPNIRMAFGCTVASVDSDHASEEHGGWPCTVTLSNEQKIDCDFVVSATGVAPNTQFMGSEFERALDGSVVVNEHMESSCNDVFAAGDCCSIRFADDSADKAVDPSDLAKDRHWFQMRLWTQARTLGLYCADAMAGHVPSYGFGFDVFAHVTKFFGLKVVLLGRYNAQGLGVEGVDYEIKIRMEPGKEFVKFVLRNGALVGAVLIGDTELEETCENLIMNGTDLSPFGDDLLDPDVSLEDYFD